MSLFKEAVLSTAFNVLFLFILETRFIHTIRETLMPCIYFLAEQISDNLEYVFKDLKCLTL